MRDTLRTLIDVRARRLASLRLSILLLFFLGLFLVIVVRLVNMQIGESGEYRTKAMENCLRSIPIPPVRAEIVDRRGTTLAVDVPAFRVIKILKNGRWEAEAIEFASAAQIVESGPTPGIFVEAVPMRTYPGGESVAHITGYVGEIGPQELKTWSKVGYRVGDRIGKSGLEREYERDITGERGKRMLFVDSLGRFLDTYGSKPSYGAPKLATTIDLRLQEAAYRALEEQGSPGAALFMEPYSGEILALVTYPSFDNNQAVGGFDPSVWKELQEDPLHPLINRSISISVPIGSVFKPVVASGAIEEGIVELSTRFYCPGYFRLGDRIFRCWETSGHGKLDIFDAIADSCDVAFYNIGHQLGVTKIRNYAKMLGLGRKTGIDLPGEAIGLLPSPEWKKNFRGEVWYEGDTVNLSIGQGFMQASPVQVLVMMNVFATHGRLVTPHLAEGGRKESARVPLKRDTLDIVREGMRQAVLRGTAIRMKWFPVPTAGKTGTAEDPPREEPHAWYAGFAPYENPKLTFAVYVENAGHGSSHALPVAMKVLQKAIEFDYMEAPAKAGKKN